MDELGESTEQIRQDGCDVKAPLMKYQGDIGSIVNRRHDNGGDYWASSDGRVYVGSPFSTIQCVSILSDLGMDTDYPVISKASKLIFNCWCDDGRFRLAPTGSIYPCHTAGSAKALCHAGYASDERLKRTFRHMLDTARSDGGWRCNKFVFGRGPETESSNPGPTLDALDAFRFSSHLNRERKLDRAVEFLLGHWETRKPLGPCHFGIGTLFMRVEYPLLRYNLLNYVYVLSFYTRAKRDPRFHEAFQALQSRIIDDKVVVENPHRKLASFSFCRKGLPSEPATDTYRMILQNLRH